MAPWNRDNLNAMFGILESFFACSCLTINIAKSSLFGIGVGDLEIDEMVASIGCSKGNLPLTYLGFPMGANMGHVANWNSFIDRFKKRLAGWQTNLLSIGGRATLGKSVLGSMGIYYLSLFKCPEKVIHELESIRASFFWGSTEDKRKIALD
ncbi:uncharacterized protein [Rutidosis leptorrhynchoides]|uniref:uncharacterized protein n=1 Tax=Rutidosis leptorrhynchoides TaxID=125765 RepID=UPI003A9A47BF